MVQPRVAVQAPILHENYALSLTRRGAQRLADRVGNAARSHVAARSSIRSPPCRKGDRMELYLMDAQRKRITCPLWYRCGSTYRWHQARTRRSNRIEVLFESNVSVRRETTLIRFRPGREVCCARRGPLLSFAKGHSHAAGGGFWALKPGHPSNTSSAPQIPQPVPIPVSAAIRKRGIGKVLFSS